MKIIRPERAVRFSGYMIILLLVVLPVALAFWATDVCEPGTEIYLYLMCFGLALTGCILVHIGFWEKCFSRLELSPEEIRWKCPLRRSRIMSVDNCVEIGAYLENEGKGIPKEQIYFSDHPNPKQHLDRNHSLKASNHLIKFWYSEALCQYLLRTYSGKQTSCLLAYRQRRKRW